MIYWLLFGVPLCFALAGGWSISILWGWFVTPVFGLPEISWATGAGLSLILSVSRAKLDLCSMDANPDLVKLTVLSTLYAVFLPLYGLFLGWILKNFIVIL